MRTPRIHRIEMLIMILMVVAFSAGLFFSCKSPDDDVPEPPAETGLHFTGLLGSGFRAAGFRDSRSSDAASEITAIPIVDGAAKLTEASTAPITETGTFDIEPSSSSGSTYLLLLTNGASATLEDKAIAFISLPVSSQDTDLVLFPTDASSGTIDFGSVSLQGDLAQSEFSLETKSEALALPFDDLVELSYWNSLHMGAKNDYVNRNLTTNQWYRFLYGQSFSGSLSAAMNKFSGAEEILSKKSYSVGIDLLDPEGFTPSEVVSGTVVLEIYPAETMTIPVSTDSFGPTTPLRTSSPLSSFVVRETPPGSLPDGFTRGLSIGGSIANPISGGFWRVSKNGADTALFDVDPAVSFTTDGVFLFYVPAFKIESDASGLVTAVSIAWLKWNSSTRVYETVADLTSFENIGTGWNLGLSNTPGLAQEYFNKAGRVTQFANQWYISGTHADGVKLTMLTTAYAIAGFSFGFSLVP